MKLSRTQELALIAIGLNTLIGKFQPAKMEVATKPSVKTSTDKRKTMWSEERKKKMSRVMKAAWKNRRAANA